MPPTWPLRAACTSNISESIPQSMVTGCTPDGTVKFWGLLLYLWVSVRDLLVEVGRVRLGWGWSWRMSASALR